VAAGEAAERTGGGALGAAGGMTGGGMERAVAAAGADGTTIGGVAGMGGAAIAGADGGAGGATTRGTGAGGAGAGGAFTRGTAAGLVSTGGGATAGRTGAGGAGACCLRMAFSTSPGREMWERSILVLISSASRVGRPGLAGGTGPADARKCARTFSASDSSKELEWVFFSVTPTSCSTSRIALLLTSSSLARSLIRILLIRPQSSGRSR